MRVLVAMALVLTALLPATPATAQDEAGIRVAVLSDTPFQVPGGDARPLRLVVANQGSDADTVFLAVRNASAGWKAQVDDAGIDLAAGAQVEVTITVSAARDAAPGRLLLRYESEGGHEGLLEVPVAKGGPPAPAPGATAAFRQCMAAAEKRIDEEMGPPGGPQWREERRERLADAAQGCCEQAGGDAQRQCEALGRVHESLGGQSHVQFVPFEDGSGFETYTVDGKLVIERAAYDSTSAQEPQVQQRLVGVKWIYGDGSVSSLDSPTGLLSVQGDGRLDLRFPEGTVLTARGALWHVSGDGWTGMLTGTNLTIDGRSVLLEGGRLTFHIAPHAPPSGPERRVVEEKVDDAIAKRHVGARVQTDGDILAYDDVDVRVDKPTGRATPDTPVTIEVAANLTEGRTIVVDLDPALFGGARGDALRLQYYDVQYVDGARHAVEVVFLRADSLDDVVDPTDDGIQPEYWIVEDADGLHLLVSVPTWSVHAITVSSVAGFVTQPSVIVGVVAGGVGTLLASAALFWPRRRDA